MALKTTLKELGFNDKEVLVYLTLLKHGRLTPTVLAKQTKINRATIYNVAKSLQGKGVIAEDLSGKTIYFVALPPESMREVIERPLRELEERRTLAEQAVKEVSVVSAQEEYPVPSIRFVEESELEDFFYGNIEKWIKSIKTVDNAWWGIQDHTWIEKFGAFGDWYWKSPLCKDVGMNLIGNESPEEQLALKKYAKKERDVRLTDDMLFTSSIWVGGDYLIMICTRNHPFYAVEIRDKTLAHNMREVFKKLWNETRVISYAR